MVRSIRGSTTDPGKIQASVLGGGSTLTSGSAPTPSAQMQGGSTQQLQESIDKQKKTQDTQELKKELQQLSEQLNKELNPLSQEIKFGFAEEIDSLYVTVSDTSTNRVIRKIPSDEAVELMVKMREVVGLIFDKKS